MINAGDFNRRITIIRRVSTTDADGFKANTDTVITKAWAKVNTTKGITLVNNGSDFEDVTTRFLIRYPSVEISRKDLVLFKGREWRIRYLNDIDEGDKFLELQVEGIRQDG